MKTNDMMDLRLFGEGGGEGGSDAGAGMQADGADASQDAARREAFELTLRENKDLYEEKVKAQLDRRMKSRDRETAQLRTDNQRFQGLVQNMASRYGIDPNDLDSIEKAFETDSSYLEEKAAKNGLTVEQQRHMDRIEAENKRLQAERERIESERSQQETISGWRQEEAEIKAQFPDFNLEAELQDPRFRFMLTGVRQPDMQLSMMDAYKYAHMDELMAKGMQYAVERTAGKVAASVRANGLRPSEGAGRGNAPARIGIDVNKMTKEQRDDLKRRAMRGEDIYL